MPTFFSLNLGRLDCYNVGLQSTLLALTIWEVSFRLTVLLFFSVYPCAFLLLFFVQLKKKKWILSIKPSSVWDVRRLTKQDNCSQQLGDGRKPSPSRRVHFSRYILHIHAGHIWLWRACKNDFCESFHFSSIICLRVNHVCSAEQCMFIVEMFTHVSLWWFTDDVKQNTWVPVFLQKQWSGTW